MAELLLQPKQMFDMRLKNQYHQEALNYYNELVKQTKTDEGANASHVKDYRAANAVLEAKKKALNSTKTKRSLLIAAMILSIVLGIIFIVVFSMNLSAIWAIVVGPILIALGGVSIWGIVKMHQKAKMQEEALKPIIEEVNQKLGICKADMINLNAAFDWNMPAVVMEKTTPLIDLDPYFSNATLEYLIKKFGFPEREDDDTTVLGITSGRIQGNPFVLEKILSRRIAPKVYTGSLTITWVEYVGSGKDRHAVTRSETLYAEAVHDAPFYSTDTRLIFGHEAAPNLCFSRQPSKAHKMSEKEREKYVRSQYKELNKKAEKDMMNGGNFTVMGNEEFEVFFHAIDRNNEPEFRVLFNPIAQKNMLDLITNPEPFGDDFYMVKDHMLTSVASAHSQSFDYTISPTYFMDYCLEDSRKRFVDYCDRYIRNLFFDLAPILSIPLYQMFKSHEYIYQNSIPGNYNCYEHEIMANGLDSDLFRPETADSSLPLILKSKNVSRDGKSDRVVIRASSFETTPMVDYVSKMGADGRMHAVPVHWTKYDYVEDDHMMEMKDTSASREKFNNVWFDKLADYMNKNGFSGYFERGIFAFASNSKKGKIKEGNDAFLDSIFG